MTVQSIWPQRNQLRLQQHCVSTDQLAQAARDRFEEYKAVLPALKPRQQQHHTPWSPPPLDLFKINYDGAVFEEANQSGTVVVIRSTQGLVIASLTRQLPQVYQVFEIKVLAAIRALEFGLEVGIDQAIVEGHSEIVVKALASKDSGFASFGLLVKVATFCATSYSRLAYAHTRREGNKVAHSLAC